MAEQSVLQTLRMKQLGGGDGGESAELSNLGSDRRLRVKAEEAAGALVHRVPPQCLRLCVTCCDGAVRVYMLELSVK